jgi:hypothetical protein
MFGRIGTHYFAFDLVWLDNADLRPIRWKGASQFFKTCSARVTRYATAIM